MIVTFAGSIFFGILCIVVSKKIKISSIVLLLVCGILLGPSSIGLGIINPESLGDGLSIIIKLAVGLILFEGGLTLDPKGYRAVSAEIRNVLTRGVLVTWLGSALAVKLIFGFTWVFSVFAGSLIIVTGPTVINPLLKRIGVKKNIHNFLHWEGVLIDPIGVFIALLCYEWIIGETALLLFGARILTGAGIGIAAGIVLSRIIKSLIIPDEAVNIFILSCALAIYTASDFIIPESGLLSVTVSGFVLGYFETPQIDRLKIYKSQLVDLLIGLLFMLLAANLRFDFMDVDYIVKITASVLAVMIIIRPLNIFFSTLGEKHFTFKEKIFLSWIAPRGIVAASMASVFAFNLKGIADSDYAAQAGFIEAFTYSVIVATVIFQGFTAKSLGRLLGVLEPEPRGWLIVGAHNVARKIASFIIEKGFSVTLIDTNIGSVNRARRLGFVAIFDNALNADAEDYPELYGIGNVLALTKNEDLNQLVCLHWSKKLKKGRFFRWSAQTGEGEPAESGEAAIVSVWNSIRLERLLAMSETECKSVLVRGVMDRPRVKHPERVLFAESGGELFPFLPENTGRNFDALMYRPFDITLDLQLKPEWVVFSSASTFKGVLLELLQTLKRDYSGLNVQAILDRLIRMEREYSSVIGRNVALPHTYIDGIDDSLVMVGKTREPLGIDGEAEGENVHIIFLVLSPKNQPDIHIQTLSEISKFIMNEENHKNIMNASSRKDLVRVFFP